MIIPTQVKKNPKWTALKPKFRTQLGKLAQRFTLGEIFEQENGYRHKSDRYILLSVEWDLDTPCGTMILNCMCLQNSWIPAPFYTKINFHGNTSIDQIRYKTVALP